MASVSVWDVRDIKARGVAVYPIRPGHPWLVQVVEPPQRLKVERLDFNQARRAIRVGVGWPVGLAHAIGRKLTGQPFGAVATRLPVKVVPRYPLERLFFSGSIFACWQTWYISIPSSA